ERGYFPEEELKTLRQLDSRLEGHPNVRRVPAVEASTGSLGQGLSIGLGMAFAGRLDRSDHRVWVMLGDGELDEGQVWEAAMCAALGRNWDAPRPDPRPPRRKGHPRRLRRSAGGDRA